MPGAYKNYDDLEEWLTKEELFALIEGIRHNRFQEMVFAAGLKGIDLEAQYEKSRFEAAKKEALMESYNEQLGNLGLEDLGVATIEE